MKSLLALFCTLGLSLNACASPLVKGPFPVSAQRQTAQAQVAQAAPGLTRYLSGSGRDVKPSLNGPSLLLAGGGSDVMAAMQAQIDVLRGCSDCPRTLDMVVLRSSGADGYNSLVGELKGLDSVESLVITQRAVAEQPEVIATVAQAELVFFAGGDQCDYVSYFKDTGLERAVKAVFARGGGVGGTSAGLAIQGSMVYDACGGSVTSSEALANPYHPAISFTHDFLSWPQMRQLVTDTHFSQRDRMGRLMAFLARGLAETGASSLTGLAVDEATALLVDARGLATVYGRNPVYLVEANHAPESVLPNQPLTYANFRLWRFVPGQRFDLHRRDLPGMYLISVREGRLSENPYVGVSSQQPR
ncbi:MAG: cyanophycinase [Candidatus Sericytochromatia bacterium]